MIADECELRENRDECHSQSHSHCQEYYVYNILFIR